MGPRISANSTLALTPFYIGSEIVRTCRIPLAVP